jgi:hypothetical protein
MKKAHGVEDLEVQKVEDVRIRKIELLWKLVSIYENAR